MKKLLMLAAVAMTFSLTGCSDASAGISDGNKVLFTIAGETTTTGDMYDIMKPKYSANSILELVKGQIYTNEKITVTDEIKKEGDKKLAEIKKGMGDSYQSSLQKSGFKDEEALKKRLIYPSLFQTELNKKYIKNNQKAVFNTTHPVKGQILQADTKKKAEDALKAIKAGDDFKTVTKKYGTSAYDGDEKLYHANSSLPSTVFEKIKASSGGLIDSVMEDSSTSKFYVVKLTNVDPTTYEQEAIDDLAVTGSTTISDDALVFFLKKYKFHIYDIDVYNGIKASKEAYIIQK